MLGISFVCFGVFDGLSTIWALQTVSIQHECCSLLRWAYNIGGTGGLFTVKLFITAGILGLNYYLLRRENMWHYTYVGFFVGATLAGLAAAYSNMGVGFGQPSIQFMGLDAWQTCTLLLVSAPTAGLTIDVLNVRKDAPWRR